MAESFSESAIKRLHLRFGGQCQGVGFRWTSRRIADELGLTGWARNEWDGSVEMELQGPAVQISQFYGQLHTFYRRMYVNFSIEESDEIPVVEGETGFAVRF